MIFLVPETQAPRRVSLEGRLNHFRFGGHVLMRNQLDPVAPLLKQPAVDRPIPRATWTKLYA